MFDEARLLFDCSSEAFLTAITQTVRLIRSKGVGVFFVTQTPKDVPADVLAQLGAWVQHALRAFTPQDAKALRATVTTFPHSAYDLEEDLTRLGIGEAMVTVLDDKGRPTPVAWTRMYAPRSRMGPSDEATMTGLINASAMKAKYGTDIDRDSAYEIRCPRARRHRTGTRCAEVRTDPIPGPCPKVPRHQENQGREATSLQSHRLPRHPRQVRRHHLRPRNHPHPLRHRQTKVSNARSPRET
ncbi:helicase HerA-like domain-containing protein [Phytomonospora endophytica]|uniref:Helicase HerA-like C-terminal domain-containing protein n=1 Tax=Phytomonospora endophytica TaxID=714109 RepID=A0A841FZ80_9ACTN|nr:helicase HerA-like domain-containing protein [Phytomonospora endophytica]MBB6038832.1 hypothetical protein [Phytomonospora endophytica]GIG68372.1 hypothetical protein Pen01_46670 [Phytomonospora endophytica]